MKTQPLKIFIIVGLVLILIAAAIFGCQAQKRDVRIADIYTFYTAVDTLIIWEFSDSVIRKSWFVNNDTDDSLRQEMFLTYTPSVDYDTSGIISVKYTTSGKDFYIIFDSENRIVLWLVAAAYEDVQYYPVVETLLPKSRKKEKESPLSL